MADEPTAWEEISPPATVSVQRQELRAQYLARLEPANTETFRNELTACLALVVPVGMTEEGRREWLSVAWITLQHLPADLLAIGCKAARETCDHPSKIVPTIIAETKDSMRLRREMSDWHPPEPPVALIEPNYCTPEEATEILQSVGLKSHFASHRSGET